MLNDYEACRYMRLRNAGMLMTLNITPTLRLIIYLRWFYAVMRGFAIKKKMRCLACRATGTSREYTKTR